MGPPIEAVSLRVRRSMVGLTSAALGVGAGLSAALAFANTGDSMPSRFESSFIMGAPSRPFEGLDGEVRAALASSKLTADFALGLGRGLGEPCFKHTSKHSSQHGRPRISTIGLLEMSLLHALHLKHEACHIRPAFSTGLPPSSLVKAKTGL